MLPFWEVADRAISTGSLMKTKDFDLKVFKTASRLVKEYGIADEKWLSDGSLAVKIKIPGGLKENVYRRLGALTEGNVRIEEAKN